MKRNIAAVSAAAVVLAVAAAAQTPPQSPAAADVITVTGCVQPGGDLAQPGNAPVGTSGTSQFVLSNPVIAGTAGAAGAMSPTSPDAAVPPRPATTATPNPTGSTTPPSTTPPSATPPPAAAPPTPTPPTSTPSPTGTTGTSSAPSSTGASATMGTRPSGSAATTTAAPTSYRLAGGQDLQRFVNQQVEIRGTIDNQVAGAGVSTTSPTMGSPRAGATTDATPPAPPTLRITSVRLIAGSCTPR